MTTEKLEVRIVVAGRHRGILVEDVVNGPTVLGVVKLGKKYRVWSEDWKDGAVSSVDEAGLLVWLEWASLGKARKTAILEMITGRVPSVCTRLTLTGKVRKVAWIRTALLKGRTFSSVIREAADRGIEMDEEGLIDQVGTFTVEQQELYLSGRVGVETRLESKFNVALMEELT